MAFRKENIHLIPNRCRSSGSQIGVLQNSYENIFVEVTFWQCCRSQGLKLKRDCGTGIFLWIFCNSSKNLIYITPPDDCSCWFLRSSQNFYLLITFIIDNCNYGSLLRKCLKMNTFLLFTIVYSKININVVRTILPWQ